jgi:tyrosine-protein kinase
VRDALDRRLRAPRDIDDELDYPMLARIRDDQLGKSLVSPNGKGPTPEAEFEPFRILRTNLEFLDPSGKLKSVMVTSGLPEEGKSTVALSLAASSAIAGKRTLLVECDLRRPSLAKRLKIPAEPGLREYLAGEATPQEVVQTCQVTGPSVGNGSVATTANLACITGGKLASNSPELLASDRCKAFFKQVSEVYDLVVVDTGPLLAVMDPMQLVDSVDGLLLCVRLSQATRDEARATRQLLERIPERPTGIVVTGVKAGEDELYGYYSYGYD